ncbi:MAG: hypothetical protein KGH75_00055 [Rhodospirillales bacterium]|nr:hypothetical protein [Rhodospirillales bacterium]
MPDKDKPMSPGFRFPPKFQLVGHVDLAALTVAPGALPEQPAASTPK